MRALPRGFMTVLGIVSAALVAIAVVVALRHDLSWYSAAALLYGMLAAAELGYLGLLLAATRLRTRAALSV